MDSLSAAAITKLSEFGQQQLANLAWAFATLGYTHPKIMDALATDVIRKISEFKPQGLANTAWAYSRLGMRNKELMEAIAAESIRKMSDFDPQNLSNIAWAYAKLGMTHEPLLDAISAEVISKLSELTPRECSGLSWAFATLRRSDVPLLDAISSKALANMVEFESLYIATTAWAYDTLKMLDGPLRDALASEALRKINSMENQPLATLVDLDLPGCGVLEERLASKIDTFADRWRSQDAFSGSNALLFEWQVDNLGIFGTGTLLEKLGVHPPQDPEFTVRARARIGAEAAHHAPEDWRKQRFFFKERVYCYAEFALAHPTVTETWKLQGTMVKENSFLGEGTRAGRTGLLRSVVLPINELVDRTLCAEFQMLSELCDLVDSVGVTGKASRGFVTGTVRLWTSGASCLSCVGIMRQFLLLFPRAVLEVKCEKRLP